ncbi:E3 ubiquitin-protein ligase ZFP91-like [Osmerus mordax]|uniref:E3 ubiquitin-protein ligase ZFP91-like n=1 Tax=Osmerus mordax TaxID=8014 RepID=UPI00350FCA01
MDPEIMGVSDRSPGSTGDCNQSSQRAAAPSPISSATPTRERVLRGRGLGRVKVGVDTVVSNDALSSIAGSGRVLRDRAARGAAARKRTESSVGVQDQNRRKKTEPPRRGKGPGAASKDTDDNNQTPATDKAPSTKVSPRSTRTRLLKSGPRSSAAPVCKAEPDTTAACDFADAEEDALKTVDGSNEDGDVLLDDEDPPFRDDPSDLNYKPAAKREPQKTRRRAAKQKEDKKEKEPDKELEDEKEVKMEVAADTAVKVENEFGEETEPPRKRGRRRKDDKTPRLPKRRKKPPVQYVRCEIEGCGTVLAHPRYLQHHIKYQHLLKKKYVCPHPSCGRLFRLQKQLLRHAKHHTDQRDYICEYCARAFKSSHNLAVHRMIHTGEKPIQCEICGFTCRQKASLNWHMKKHDADAFYKFSCSICGKKFEKKDCVVAHKAKSHPEVLIAEALAANAGTLITTPTPVLETVSGVCPPTLPPVSQESQGDLTPLHQMVLSLSPQTQMDSSQPQLLQLASHHVVQVGQQQQENPMLLQFSTAHPHLSTPQPQLIQLTAHPATTTTSMTASGSHTTLLTLSSVAALSPAPLAPHQTVEWVREGVEETQGGGEGVLWERVTIGSEPEEMVWAGDGEKERVDGGIVWEREGEGQILLESTEVQVSQGDSHVLM